MQPACLVATEDDDIVVLDRADTFAEQILALTSISEREEHILQSRLDASDLDLIAP